MKYLKIFETFGDIAEITNIYISDERLMDIIIKFNLKMYELEIIKQIFDKIPYFKSNNKSNKQFVNKFINSEDINDVYTSGDDIKNMDFNDYCFYNQRNRENILPALKYYINNPNTCGVAKRDKLTNKIIVKQGNLLSCLEYILNKLENPISSDKILYAK